MYAARSLPRTSTCIPIRIRQIIEGKASVHVRMLGLAEIILGPTLNVMVISTNLGRIFNKLQRMHWLCVTL